MRKSRQTWTPIPLRWFSDVGFLSLSETTLKVALLLWIRSDDGTVPKDAKEAQLLSGYPVKPGRVQKALEELTGAGILVESGDRLFFADWGRIFRKSGAKSDQVRSKFPDQNRKNPEGSALHSRARNLSPTEIDRLESEKRDASLEGRLSSLAEDKAAADRKVSEIFGKGEKCSTM
jgi:hypothetical protein